MAYEAGKQTRVGERIQLRFDAFFRSRNHQALPNWIFQRVSHLGNCRWRRDA